MRRKILFVYLVRAAIYRQLMVLTKGALCHSLAVHVCPLCVHTLGNFSLGLQPWWWRCRWSCVLCQRQTSRQCYKTCFFPTHGRSK